MSRNQRLGTLGAGVTGGCKPSNMGVPDPLGRVAGTLKLRANFSFKKFIYERGTE